jgi:hypothetical protein
MTNDPITKEIDELEEELGTAAIQLIVTLIAVAVVSFGFGYITGIN